MFITCVGCEYYKNESLLIDPLQEKIMILGDLVSQSDPKKTSFPYQALASKISPI